MQIRIDKRTGALVAVVIVLLAVILGLSVNKNSGSSSMGTHHNSGAKIYTGADVMFLQMMIPHHQQAIAISNIALKKSKDAELLALATTIIKSQSAEIIQMESWLADSNSSPGMGHSMSGMGGMLNEAQLSALSAATGKTFDTLWLKGMTGHHDGAIHMTMMIRDARNPNIKAFGEKVVKEQSAQIVQMNAMLKRIG